MNIEKRNIKMFSIITILVLAAILLTAFGGFMMQRQTMPLRDGGMGINRGANPMMQPQSAQTGPTGRLVISAGILLLVAGFGILVLMLWVWRTRVHRNPS